MTRAALIDELKNIWNEATLKMKADGEYGAAQEIDIAISVLERTYTESEKFGIH